MPKKRFKREHLITILLRFKILTFQFGFLKNLYFEIIIIIITKHSSQKHSTKECTQNKPIAFK